MHDWSDEQALTYDQQWGALTFHTQIPSLARVEAGNRIVELGCGGGYLSLCLAKFAPEVKVLGLDPTAKMIKLAQNRRQEAGVDATHLTFLQVAAEELEVQPDSLDLAIAAFSVHHWQEPKLGMSLVYQ